MKVTFEEFIRLIRPELLDRESRLVEYLKLYSNTSRYNYFDVVDSVLYDRVVLLGKAKQEAMDKFNPREASHQTLFRVPMGQMCPYSLRVKTLVDTNLYQCSMLPMPESFIIKGVGFVSPQAETRHIVKEGHWQLVVCCKVYAQGPTLFETHIGKFQRKFKESWTDGGIPGPLGTEIVIDPKIQQDFRITSSFGGIHIHSGMTFHLDVTWPEEIPKLPHDFDLWACLVGYEFREIQ